MQGKNFSIFLKVCTEHWKRSSVRGNLINLTGVKPDAATFIKHL